jgi:hypothetical protein
VDPVAEVPQHLPGDGGDGEGQKVDPAPGVEPVHGQDQPHRRDLLEILRGLAPVAVPAGDAPGHRQVSGDQLPA